MPAALSLYNAVYAKLTGATGASTFHEAVGGRIGLVRAKPDQVTPHAVIVPISNTPRRAFDSQDDVELAFLTELYGDPETATQPFLPEALVAIQDKLTALLDREYVTAAGYGNAQVWATDLGNLTHNGGAWVITQSWKLTATPI